MAPTSMLPVLMTSGIIILIASVAALLALWWEQRPRIRMVVQRIWLIVAVLSVLGVVIFWIASGANSGSTPTIDKSLQQKQQNELHQRLENGGH